MQQLRRILIAGTAALVALACSDGGDKLPGSHAGGTSGKGGAGGAPGGAGGGAGMAGSGAAGGSAGAGGSGGTSGAGGLAGSAGTGGTIIVPTTDCTDATKISKTVYAPAAIDGLYALEPAGNRWAASGAIGFVFFDADGANPSAAPLQPSPIISIAGSSSDLLVAGIGNGSVDYAFYNSSGTPAGSTSSLFTGDAFEVATGRSGANSLVVWSTQAGPKARALSGSSAEATTFDLEGGSATDHLAVAIAPSANGEFAIAWSDRRQSDGQYRTFFAFANTSGLVGLAHLLFSDPKKQMVAAIAPTANGFVVLEDFDGVPTLILVDKNGMPDGPARILSGAMHGFGLASQADRVVVVARRTDHREAIRAFDLGAGPVGPWVCLMPESPGSEHAAAIHADSTGYTVLYRAPDESEQLVHITDPTTGK